MKTCTACRETKPLDSFYFKKTRSVYETRCKDCINESKRKFATENPDRIRAWSKAWNSKTRERQKEYAKNWRDGNRDRHRAASLRWIENNREVHRARMRITVFNRRRAEKSRCRTERLLPRSCESYMHVAYATTAIGPYDGVKGLRIIKSRYLVEGGIRGIMW